MTDWIKTAAQSGARLVLLPEMSLNGYLYRSKSQIQSLAEEAQGPSFAHFSQLCKQLGVYLVYGFAEKKAPRLYNSQNLIGPGGELLGTYQKRHLFEADRPWASAGSGPFLAVPTPIGRLGLGICMDLNFNDLPFFHQQQKTDLLCLSMHWLEEGQNVNQYWSARLLPFDGVTLIANGHGLDQGTHYAGRSGAYHKGRWLALAEPSGDRLLVVTVETN
ncbi:MAG: hypothetical protein A2600_06115 [Candidatus Lambdaproteobacteria bacterium RIFOXYD1_FULL_56_27]|uniref:CN hydrolase domain-containing protein n=1 Tax=Candidatus Lambdaproteobacteria bacterium RIFOXYD2_FULL_56_26 TaxID=1817773 RepID=A0A1F6GLE3_9PROT|nr:MAG: hypothetical protein A2557_13085 [Candidatus Lambdaproteobacteria bacterium RIFOXYD2_FULL_56_26]OGH05462.1 MAG: hypothetical protein A2426_03685 [Candidatus Lambdaproteobacteria bacterium RIFOXYC1_FULL_56_13]OGH09753.1 MAG: hypothetical protein A2600_06115 [Candidatus Lambdaproteobacteria bacterium RIFOXYD1_FULL_56_27]